MYNEHGVCQEDEGDLAAPLRITSSKPRRTIPGTGASSDHDESSGTAKVPAAAAATGRAKGRDEPRPADLQAPPPHAAGGQCRRLYQEPNGAIGRMLAHR